MRLALLALLAPCALACGGSSPDPVSPPVSDPVADPVSDPVADPASDPVADPVPAPDAAPSLPAFAQTLLDEHNRHRASHCAPPLAWSDELAATAQRWADRCEFEHSSHGYGENLAMGTASSLDAARTVELWYREVDDYDFARPGFSGTTGHFTQLVWKASTKLGCGSATCGGMTLWVCNYDPAGNELRAFEANVLPTSCRR